MNQRIRSTVGRLAVVLALAMAGAVAAVAPTAATAKPVPDPNPTSTLGGFSTDSSGGGGTITCTGIATSVHPSGNNAQWEGHINCNAVGELLLRINVYRLVGTGENLRKEWVDASQPPTKVSSFLDLYDGRQCNGTASTRWQLNHYAYFNGNPFTPSPAWSPVTTLNCGA